MKGLILIGLMFFANVIAEKSSVWDAWNFDTPPGAASYQLLKIETDPRIISLGGGGVSLGGQASASTEVNPAAAAQDSFKLSATHSYPFKESGSMISGLTWNIPVGAQKILIHYRFLGFGNDIRGFDAIDEQTGDYGAHTYKVGLGYARQLKQFSLGSFVSFVENNIAEVKYYTFIIDLGGQYEVSKGLRVGAALNNGPMWLSEPENEGNDPIIPPVTARAGVSYSRLVYPEVVATLSIDAKSRNEEKLHLPSGIEIVWRDLLAFRMGYPLLRDQDAFTFGAGVQLELFKFDYAVKFFESLSAGHYMSLGLKF